MIETPRLVLRFWREDDKPAFDAIINTPAMMEHFGGVRPRADIDALVDKLIVNQERDGHTMWAVDHKADGALAGVCGVRLSGYPGTAVSDELEIGWRIAEPIGGSGSRAKRLRRASPGAGPTLAGRASPPGPTPPTTGPGA